MVKKTKKEENDLKDLIDAVTPLIDAIGPYLQKTQENNLPIIKRSQWMNFVIMISLVIVVVGMAALNIIDGSAATGLIGAIIGYVFGHIYSNRNQK